MYADVLHAYSKASAQAVLLSVDHEETDKKVMEFVAGLRKA